MADLKTPIGFQQPPAAGQSSHTHQRHQQGPQRSWNPQEERRVRHAIADAAVQNTELLGELSTTMTAVGQLGHNEVRINRLEKLLQEQNTQVLLTTSTANSQLKRHKRYRNSVARKLVYTITNKRDEFDRTAMEVEEAYHGALDSRRKAEDRLTELKTNEADLAKEKEALFAMVKRHQAAHEAIDALYAKLFDGPTPGFPDEDEQEAQRRRADLQHKEATEELKATVKSFKTAATIKVAIERATLEKSTIHLEARSSLGSLTYVGSRMERLAIYAKRGLELSHLAVEDLARPLDSAVVLAKNTVDALLRSILAMAQERIMSRSHALALVEKIGDLLKHVQEAQKIYAEEIKAVNTARRLAIRDTARALENERQSLQQIRQSLFEITVGFGAAAPPYHECCDRADSFEDDSDAQCSRIVEPVVTELPDMPPPPGYVQEHGQDGIPDFRLGQEPDSAREEGQTGQQHILGIDQGGRPES